MTLLSTLPQRYQLLILVLFSLSCVTPSGSQTSDRIAISDGWLAMGTFFEVEVRVSPAEAERARIWIEWARQEILRLENVYSRHDPESAVTSLNEALSYEDVLMNRVKVDLELESILFLAIEVWAGSGGAFDMTIGPLVDVWTEAVSQETWPSVAALREAKKRLGSEAILFLGDGRLEILKTGLRIDLDGLSKGRVLDQLRARFVEDLPGAAALLNFGESSILAIGDPDGGGWRLAVRSRNQSDGSLTDRRGTALRLRDQALSVSSSLGAVSEIAGEEISHVIDPRTGSPLSKGVQAFVIADRAGLADGWSTALLVLGADKTALRLIEQAGVEADIRESSGPSISTKSWESFYLEE